MLYSFEGQLISEGNRSFIRIPFNIWEETGLKGTIPARIKANDCLSVSCFQKERAAIIFRSINYMLDHLKDYWMFQ